jgi:hypothetical protein
MGALRAIEDRARQNRCGRCVKAVVTPIAKNRPRNPGAAIAGHKRPNDTGSTLTRLEAAVGFVDHIGAATTANHAVVAVAPL